MLIEEPEFYEYKLVFPHPDQPFCHELGGMIIPGIDTIQGCYLQNNPKATRNYSIDMIVYCGIETEISPSCQPQIIEDKHYDSVGDSWSYFAPDFEGDDILLCDEDRNYRVCDVDVFRDLEQERHSDYKYFSENFFDEAYYRGNKSLIPRDLN